MGPTFVGGLRFTSGAGTNFWWWFGARSRRRHQLLVVGFGRVCYRGLMASTTAQKLFGSQRRTEVLILIALLEETFPTEIAKLLDARLYSVQKIVDGLEEDGIVASQFDGRTRIVTLDPSFAAAEQLKTLLVRLIDVNPKIRRIVARRRSRHGRRGRAVT